MLRFASTTIAPEHEPPRPTIRPYWREVEVREDTRYGEDEDLGGIPYGGIPWQSGDVRVTRNWHGDINIEEPQLEDFLQGCEEYEGDQCGRTFEQFDSGTLRWRARSLESGWYTEVEHYIEKAGGLVVAEGHTKYGGLHQVRVAPGQDGWVLEPYEWHTKVHSYYACAPALRTSSERTYVLNPTLASVLSGVTPAPGGAGTMLQSSRDVRQVYQAEGWLRSRIETSMEFERWIEIETENMRIRYPAYKQSTRDELYTPVGGGVWHHKVSDTTRVPVPIVQEVEVMDEEGETTVEEEVVGIRYAISSQSYTQKTDSPPPTVSREQAGTCEERGHEAYAEAMKRYEEAVGVELARRANNPPVFVVSTMSTDRPTRQYRLGDMVKTPAGSGFVTRVSWEGQRPADGEPSNRMSIEAWSGG